MGASSGNAAKKRGSGRPFQKGESGNPLGLSSGTRERRRRVAQALDEAFTGPGGVDTLVEAIREGVEARDSTCLKLACSYRWGNPENFVNLADADGQPVRLRADQLTDDQLAAIISQALPTKTNGETK